MPHIIGTAGHIDHGKTALIRALTGQETDRLKEEKERGISIDLGFAYLDLSNGERVGIVDVPGHERFIRNMLAGAHGIDLVLLVVAADDGVMPQTEEHLDILHLLGARTASSRSPRRTWSTTARLAAVREEIEILLAGTTLEGAPIVAVSSVTGLGLERLAPDDRGPLAGYARAASDGLLSPAGRSRLRDARTRRGGDRHGHRRRDPRRATPCGCCRAARRRGCAPFRCTAVKWRKRCTVSAWP